MVDIKDWVKQNDFFRKKVVSKNENNELQILLANFQGTAQKKDIEVRTKLPGDYSRVKISYNPFHPFLLLFDFVIKERLVGIPRIELGTETYQVSVLPLNYMPFLKF